MCPDAMACIFLSSMFVCVWPSTILVAGCPGYCAELGGHCDSRVAGGCCEGMACVDGYCTRAATAEGPALAFRQLHDRGLLPGSDLDRWRVETPDSSTD